MKEDELIAAVEYLHAPFKDMQDFWVGTRSTTGGSEDLPIPEEERYAEVWIWPGEIPSLEEQKEWVSQWRKTDDYLRFLEAKVRDERDAFLSVVDGLTSKPLLWADLSSSEQDEVRQYRQELLDVPQQQGFPKEVRWPNQPKHI